MTLPVASGAEGVPPLVETPGPQRQPPPAAQRRSSDGGGRGGGGDVNPDQKEALLRGSFIFRDLDPEILRRLASVTQVMRVPAGALLFQQGDEGDSLYAVIEGLVRISVSGQGGRELII